MSKPYDSVFFDFGGTLFSYLSVGIKTLDVIRSAAERLGADPGMEVIGKRYREASRASYARYLPRPYYLHRDLFHDTFRGFAVALGAEPSDAYLNWHHEEQRRVLLERFELRPDCVATLRAMRDAGLHLSIVSNIDDDYLHPMLERCGLDEILHGWTSSEEARSCKPDERIFQYALEKAGTTADRVLFVGDSIEADIVGARRVGMRSAWIREPGAEPFGAGHGEHVEPDYTVTSLEELLPLVGVEAG